MSADDRGKRARQWPRTFSTTFVSFSEMETAPKSVSHYYTKALSNRVIVHLSKSNRVRVRRVQRPSGPVFAVSGGDGEKGFRVRVPENPCGTGLLTKKNCTATLTHIVSKLPCSYGGAE